MQKQMNGPAEDITLLDYLRIFKKRKKTIGVLTASAFILSLAVSLLLPKVFSSTASVLPPKPEDMLLSSGLSPGSSVSGLAGGLLSKSTPADLWVGILKSRNVREEVVRKFNLQERYGSSTLSGALKALDGNVKVQKSDAEIITITVEDGDPETAAAMANAFVEELDRVNMGSTMTTGQRTRAFIEKRLSEAKDELRRTEDSLREFQEKNKAIKLDDQSKAIIEAIGNVKGQLIAKEVELETLLSYAAPTNPAVGLLKSEVKGLKDKLRELESGVKGEANPVAKNVFIPTDRIPELAFRYVRLLRDAKMQETLFELLAKQYEIARIQEAKDSPTIQFLDKARPADRKSKPKRALIVSLSTLAGFCFSVLAVFVLEYFTLKNGLAGDLERT